MKEFIAKVIFPSNNLWYDPYKASIASMAYGKAYFHQVCTELENGTYWPPIPPIIPNDWLFKQAVATSLTPNIANNALFVNNTDVTIKYLDKMTIVTYQDFIIEQQLELFDEETPYIQWYLKKDVAYLMILVSYKDLDNPKYTSNMLHNIHEHQPIFGRGVNRLMFVGEILKII